MDKTMKLFSDETYKRLVKTTKHKEPIEINLREALICILRDNKLLEAVRKRGHRISLFSYYDSVGGHYGYDELFLDLDLTSEGMTFSTYNASSFYGNHRIGPLYRARIGLNKNGLLYPYPSEDRSDPFGRTAQARIGLEKILRDLKRRGATGSGILHSLKEEIRAHINI